MLRKTPGLYSHTNDLSRQNSHFQQKALQLYTFRIQNLGSGMQRQENKDLMSQLPLLPELVYHVRATEIHSTKGGKAMNHEHFVNTKAISEL